MVPVKSERKELQLPDLTLTIYLVVAENPVELTDNDDELLTIESKSLGYEGEATLDQYQVVTGLTPPPK